MSLLSLPERLLQRLVELPLELFSMILGSQKALKRKDTGAPFGRIYSWRYNPAGAAREIRRERLAQKRSLSWYRYKGYYSEAPGTTPIPLPGRQYRKRGRAQDSVLWG